MLRIEGLHIGSGAFRLTADLALPAGGLTAVIGPSGAGKSTLLSAIGGFAAVETGRILWQGRDLTPLPPWDRPVATLFQDGNLFPHLTLAQNAALALTPAGRPTAAQRAQVAAMLARVGLEGLADRRPGQVSGGQASRAALARVLLQDRPLVLMDEPFAALGPGLRDEMLHLAAAMLAETGRTVLFVTHAPDEARGIATGVVTVLEGVASGPHPLTILDAPPPALAAYLGRPAKG